jgi:5,10-methylenetetrahydrofolate reductase
MVDEGVDLQGNKIHEPPKLHVGMAANPGAIPLEPEILKLERKVNIGAEFIQTQVVYDIEVAKKFLDATSHLKIPIIIGICPLKSYAMAKFMNQFVPGVVIPDEIMARVKKAEKMSKEQLWKENIEIFGELIREIRKTRAAGVHIMAVGFEKIVPSLIEAGTK